MNDDIIETDSEVKSNTNMTAGEMLRNARTTGRRKREMQTIAKQLCIREDFLQALEDGNYAALPEVVYILGFARNYAIELGLDPKVVVEQIKHELGLTNENHVANDETVFMSKKVETEKPKREYWSKIMPMLKQAWAYIMKHWKWSAGIAGGVLLLILILVIVFSDGSGKTDNTLTDAQVVATNEPSEPAYTQPVRERFGLKNRETATIILQANKSAGEVGTWVQIEDARGKKELSQILFPGDIFYMPAGNGYRGTFGNVAGIDFWVDGVLAPTVKANRNAKVPITPENLLKPANK
ncbi:MAG: helix-turn-helix domain-containing protein [Alphaproteobacteria bacterium]|nr:helix-turn-helix domain-containing protein [Alphaproteobacteria bacterium]